MCSRFVLLASSFKSDARGRAGGPGGAARRACAPRRVRAAAAAAARAARAAEGPPSRCDPHDLIQVKAGDFVCRAKHVCIFHLEFATHTTFRRYRFCTSFVHEI